MAISDAQHAFDTALAADDNARDTYLNSRRHRPPDAQAIQEAREAWHLAAIDRVLKEVRLRAAEDYEQMPPRVDFADGLPARY